MRHILLGSSKCPVACVFDLVYGFSASPGKVVKISMWLRRINIHISSLFQWGGRSEFSLDHTPCVRTRSAGFEGCLVHRHNLTCDSVNTAPDLWVRVASLYIRMCLLDPLCCKPTGFVAWQLKSQVRYQPTELRYQYHTGTWITRQNYFSYGCTKISTRLGHKSRLEMRVLGFCGIWWSVLCLNWIISFQACHVD